MAIARKAYIWERLNDINMTWQAAQKHTRTSTKQPSNRNIDRNDKNSHNDIWQNQGGQLPQLPSPLRAGSRTLIRS